MIVQRRFFQRFSNFFLRSLFVAVAAAQTVTVTEYPISTSDSRPSRAITGPDGALWFTEFQGNKIGRITTAGLITEFNVPTSAAQPTGIASGPDGALWFTEQAANKIGRLTTQGAFTEFPLPKAASQPIQIVAGPDGALWFNEGSGNRIGRITTAGAITEFPLPAASSLPVSIAPGLDGALWFTEQSANKIGRITTAGMITEFPVPTANSRLVALTPGPDGALWFTEQVANQIGRITTAGVITEFPVPTSSSGPAAITNGPDSALWFTELTAGKIGRITPAGAFTEYGVLTAGSQPNGITTGPDGNLWFTETAPAANRIGKAASTFVGGSLLGSLGHSVSEGGWNTRTVLVNLGSAPAQTHLKFYGDSGADLPNPVAYTGTGIATIASSVDQTLAPNALATIDSAGTGLAPTQSGSTQLFGDTSASGFAIFSFPAFKWDAVVPLEDRNAPSYILAFDNTGALATGVAVSNIAAAAGVIVVTVNDDTGTLITTANITLSARGHISFLLKDQYPGTANRRGTVRFQTPNGGQISVIGLRANGGALTTLPVLANVGTAGGSITHVTYNGGFTSVFFIVNTGTAAAPFTLSFFDENGGALAVPLSLPQTGTTSTTTALTAMLAAGAVQVVETIANDAAASISGSARLTTTGNVSGFEIFRWTTFGQEASVPLETRSPNGFVLVFDNTGGLTTGVALANANASSAIIAVRIYDNLGNLLQTTAINLPALGHTSFLLPSTFAATADKIGFVEFVVPQGGKINAIGLRAKGDGTLTTIPILVR